MNLPAHLLQTCLSLSSSYLDILPASQMRTMAVPPSPQSPRYIQSVTQVYGIHLNISHTSFLIAIPTICTLIRGLLTSLLDNTNSQCLSQNIIS